MGELLKVTEFRGVNTNSPAGVALQPTLLENVNLDHSGGWSPMWERTLRLSGITRAMSAGAGAGLFVETGSGVGYWPGGSAGITSVAPGVALTSAVLLMPNLLLTQSGYVTNTGITAGSSTTPVGQFTAGVSATAPTDGNGLAAGPIYDVIVLIDPLPGAAYQGSFTYLDIGSGRSGAYLWQVEWTGASPVPQMRVFLRQRVAGTGKYVYLGRNAVADGRITQGVVIRTSTTAAGYGITYTAAPAYTDGVTFAITYQAASAYHQGRVYLAPGSASYASVDGETGVTTKTDAVPSRIYFSEIIAKATLAALPAFNLVNYFDVPFRVSTRVVGMASVGNYLYIFGDRELVLLTGDPSADARIETIGDSLGAVSTSSIQQLGGIVYWLSDSGLMAVQGGQVGEAGADVRDQLLGLGALISTSVDFRREQYLITDGNTILVYHAREKAWTTRQKEGVGAPSLLYAGGIPMQQDGGELYAIGGEAPLTGTASRLYMRVRFPTYELGSWEKRKEFSGLLFGIDASGAATISNTSTVDDQTANTQVMVPAGSPAVRLHLSSGSGVGMSGGSLGVAFTVITQASRAIVRPPLVVTGNLNGDEMWQDNVF